MSLQILAYARMTKIRGNKWWGLKNASIFKPPPFSQIAKVIPAKAGTVIPAKAGTVIPAKAGTVIPAKAGTFFSRISLLRYIAYIVTSPRFFRLCQHIPHRIQLMNGR